MASNPPFDYAINIQPETIMHAPTKFAIRGIVMSIVAAALNFTVLCCSLPGIAWGVLSYSDLRHGDIAEYKRKQKISCICGLVALICTIIAIIALVTFRVLYARIIILVLTGIDINSPQHLAQNVQIGYP